MEDRNRDKAAWIGLLAVILLGLLLRAAIIAKELGNFNLTGDARNYHLMSHQLVDRGIYGYWYEGLPYGGSPGVSNARVTPGYPLFLSAVYLFFHDKYLQITIARILQGLIGGLVSPLLAFLFVKRLCKRRDAALLTALFTAVYPTYVRSTVFILTEVLSLATMLLFFYLMTAAMQEKKLLPAFLAGGAFGLHVLVRPTILPLFVLPFIFALLERAEFKSLLRLFSWSAAGAAVVMLPWAIRNAVVLGDFIVTASGSGNPLLAGTYPYMRPGMPGFMADVPEEIKGISHLQARFALKRIIEGFTSQPWLYIKWFTVGKTRFMLEQPWLYIGSNRLFRIMQLLFHSFLVWGGLAGAILSSLRDRTSRYFYLFGLAFLALYLMFIPENRYAYQLIFFLMVGAAWLLCRAAEALKALYIKRRPT